MLKRLLFLSCGFLLMTSNAFAQIEVVSQDSPQFGVGVNTSPATSYTVSNFDAGVDTKLVVSFAMEVTSPNFSVTFGGAQLTEIVTSSDASGGSHTGIFFLDGANGVGTIVVNTGSPTNANGAGIFIQALSGAESGFETSGTLGNGQAVFGDLTGTLTGISQDAHITSMFIDQNVNFADQTVTGLTEVSTFGGGFLDQIGSAIAQAANGTGTGGDITVTFNDLGPATEFHSRSNASYASFAVEAGTVGIIGDVNTDGIVNFLDIAPFIGVLSMIDVFQFEADTNQDGLVNFLDIAPFIGVLAGS